jgi:hypothetical protein
MPMAHPANNYHTETPDTVMQGNAQAARWTLRPRGGRHRDMNHKRGAGRGLCGKRKNAP